MLSQPRQGCTFLPCALSFLGQLRNTNVARTRVCFPSWITFPPLLSEGELSHSKQGTDFLPPLVNFHPRLVRERYHDQDKGSLLPYNSRSSELPKKFTKPLVHFGLRDFIVTPQFVVRLVFKTLSVINSYHREECNR
eukprot:Gb_07215 [translate_table: standard]